MASGASGTFPPMFPVREANYGTIPSASSSTSGALSSSFNHGSLSSSVSSALSHLSLGSTTGSVSRSATVVGPGSSPRASDVHYLRRHMGPGAARPSLIDPAFFTALENHMAIPIEHFLNPDDEIGAPPPMSAPTSSIAIERSDSKQA